KRDYEEVFWVCQLGFDLFSKPRCPADLPPKTRAFDLTSPGMLSKHPCRASLLCKIRVNPDVSITAKPETITQFSEAVQVSENLLA
ncbi:hypothetical protein, partial [Bordetella trematum]|uniref:hypothetical protein n=1 Tax=Bordetella trematum TaxID=123899 RepID=UPI003988E754